MNEEKLKKVQIQNGGRLRKHDRDEIAEKLVQWSTKDSSLNLCGFCAENMITPQRLTEWAKSCERFQEALAKAKCFIAFRRENKVSSGELHLKSYDLNVATYDYFLKQERREHLEFEHGLKKELFEFIQKIKSVIQDTVPPELNSQFESLMNQITALQANRKIEALQVNCC